MPRAISLLAAAAVCLGGLWVACIERNPAYCEAPSDCPSGQCDLAANRCLTLSGGDGGTDGPPLQHCADNRDCTESDRPICHAGLCVGCLTTADCSGGRVCNGTTNLCEPCTSDAQCQPLAGLCVDGVCPPAESVAWVSCAGTTCPGTGSAATPYCAINDALGAHLPYVAMAPGSCSYPAFSINGQTVDVLGHGAQVSAGHGQDGIDVQGAGQMVLRDLEIKTDFQDAHSGVVVTGGARLRLDHVIIHAFRANLPGGNNGVRADMAGMLEVSSCLIYQNDGWGIQVQDTPYLVENSFIVANGAATGTPPTGTGGVRIVGSGSTGRFAYNTVASNLFELQVMGPNGAGVQCETAATLVDSLLTFNANGVATNDVRNVNGTCTLDHSVQTSNLALGAAATDVYDEPSAPQNSIRKGGGFHLRSGVSQVVGQGVPLADPTVDYDGDTRPTSPAMTTPGADEPL
jgi:hypothetical protein